LHLVTQVETWPNIVRGARCEVTLPITGAMFAHNSIRRAGTMAFVIAAALVAVMLTSLNANAETLTGKIVRVSDGDTLVLRTNPPADYRIRIAGIDAPEKGQAFGRRSQQSLAKLVLNRQAMLDCFKIDQFRRRICRVVVDGIDVALEQVRLGNAWWFRRFASEQTSVERSAFERAETEARRRRLGLWGEANPIAPWDWRASKKSSPGH
jgi:endonuclease YncB( thermonuclease family)